MSMKPCIKCGGFVVLIRGRVCADCQRITDERRIALRKANPVPKALRDAVIARDGMVCRHCGRPVRDPKHKYDRGDDSIEIDHVVPICLGGKSTFENLVVSCCRCNKQRGNRMRQGAA